MGRPGRLLLRVAGNEQSPREADSMAGSPGPLRLSRRFLCDLEDNKNPLCSLTVAEMDE
jgi:hypothetical protein